MHTVGLSPAWIINQCFGLDEDCLSFVPKPTIAVIVTFETLPKDEEKPVKEPLKVKQDAVEFYMKQSENLDYACGLIACLHSILNNREHLQITEGSILDKYYQTAKDKAPKDKAALLEAMDDFHAAHAAFAAQG